MRRRPVLASLVLALVATGSIPAPTGADAPREGPLTIQVVGFLGEAVGGPVLSWTGTARLTGVVECDATLAGTARLPAVLEDGGSEPSLQASLVEYAVLLDLIAIVCEVVLINLGGTKGECEGPNPGGDPTGPPTPSPTPRSTPALTLSPSLLQSAGSCHFGGGLTGHGLIVIDAFEPRPGGRFDFTIDFASVRCLACVDRDGSA